mgnify:CR=1 FL=1
MSKDRLSRKNVVYILDNLHKERLDLLDDIAYNEVVIEDKRKELLLVEKAIRSLSPMLNNNVNGGK